MFPTRHSRPTRSSPTQGAAGDPFHDTLADRVDRRNPDLLDRFLPLAEHIDARRREGLWPYRKAAKGRVGPRVRAEDDGGRPLAGLNLASQDYLGLAGHPAIIDAVCAAAHRVGVHSAGSAVLMGRSDRTQELEARVATFLQAGQAALFPTGWAAGYGIIRALVGPGDHVVIDALAHACLREGATAATDHVHSVPHLSVAATDRRLARIRAEHPDAGVLVVTETIFSMDSDAPDLRALQDLAQSHRATLLVDVAHDLGALGPGGRGLIGEQGMLGAIDIVMGSFSKTFASNGGFVASSHPALRDIVSCFAGPHTFSNALSPLQVAAILGAFDIIESAEGDARRGRLLRNALRLREALTEEGFEVLGQPSAIVPVVLGDTATARLLTREVLCRGSVVNLVEHPAVPRHAGRWRLQVMADHEPDELAAFAGEAAAARRRVQGSGGTLAPVAA